MAIGIYFPVSHMSREQFDEVHQRLSDIGHAEPDGRISHTAFDVGDGIHVFDVWESPEKFEAFGTQLMPILGELGIDAGQPVIGEVVPPPT